MPIPCHWSRDFSQLCFLSLLSSLFPTMPRHNFWKVKPLVKSLCAKYGVQYEEKPLGKAFVDIVG